jgi:hypothetical protein
MRFVELSAVGRRLLSNVLSMLMFPDTHLRRRHHDQKNESYFIIAAETA